MTPLLFILYEQICRKRMADKDDMPADDEIDEQRPVIIAGIGRFGQIVNRLVQSSGFETVVLDHDLETIQLMRKFGFKGFFGDPTRPELLHAAGHRQGPGAGRGARRSGRGDEAGDLCAQRLRPDLHIIARARDRTHVYAALSARAPTTSCARCSTARCAPGATCSRTSA